MKKLKRGHKAGLITLGVIAAIVIVIVLALNWDAITLKKYEYDYDQNSIGGTPIEIDGAIFKQITESEFEVILTYSETHDLKYFADETIGQFDYKYINYLEKENTAKYRIKGNIDRDERVLILCNDLMLKLDVRDPDMYFCRADIYDYLTEKLEGLDKHLE